MLTVFLFSAIKLVNLFVMRIAVRHIPLLINRYILEDVHHSIMDSFFCLTIYSTYHVELY